MIKKYILILLCILVSSTEIFAQQIEDAWVFFTDKPQANTYLSNPLSMLSQRSLDRRAKYNISLDIKDVPIDNNYLNQIANTSGITLKAKSKWLNAVHIQGLKNDILNLLNFPFVSNIEFANKSLNTSPKRFSPNNLINNKTLLQNYNNYGFGYGQIHLLNGEIVHRYGYTGKGVLIGIIDAGFKNVNTDTFFTTLYTKNRIKDVYNFVSNDTNVYQFSMHGSAVLSTIVANDQGNFVGTAPDADLALYVSEDVSKEMPIEESYWAEAAERADSIGVDVINTSLGYMMFDRSEYDYSMSDLDGETSFITRAANIAVSRGIDVVVAAGNSALGSWPKIGFPADSPYVIAVGATDISGVRANFSSLGPTFDGRIKPDVMAVGKNATAFWNGQIRQINGTSLASPITAGMIACWVQAQPTINPYELKQKLLKISNRFSNPDNEYGFGIPNFKLADFIKNMENVKNKIYPNPFSTVIYVNRNYELSNYKIINFLGQIVLKGKFYNRINLDMLSNGIYLLNIDNQYFKIIKNE